MADMESPDDSGLIPVIALIDTFLGGKMTVDAFCEVYVLLYPRQDRFVPASSIELQNDLWWAAEDFGGGESPTEDEVRFVAKRVRQALVERAEKATNT